LLLSGKHESKNEEGNEEDVEISSTKGHGYFVLQEKTAGPKTKESGQTAHQDTNTLATADCSARAISTHSSGRIVNGGARSM